MGEPRAKTLQERMGFRDTDLASPGHDALMLWLSEPVGESGLSRAADAARRMHRKTLPERTVDSMVAATVRSIEWNYPGDGRAAKSIPVPEPPVSVNARKYCQKACVWERPVMSGSYTVGFIDILVELQIDALELSFDRYEKAWTWESLSTRKSYAFEVKPTIPSLGALIRQVRLYQTYCPDVHFVVVSPDTRFRANIESQGVGFFEVPSAVWAEINP